MEDFDKIVEQGIDNVPKMYQDKLKNVVFKVEDEPSQQQREKLGLRPCQALYGLYEGVPLTQRGGGTHSIVPDVITVFRHPMTEIFTDELQLKKQIFETIWHEVAHYFGLKHSDIDRAKTAQ